MQLQPQRLGMFFVNTQGKRIGKTNKETFIFLQNHLSFQNGTVEVLKSNIIKEVFKKGLISVTISSDKGSISSELVDY